MAARAPAKGGQKERIRREAARLFARNGYDATGVQELWDAVGLGRGALHHHIGSKERLLFEVITVHVADVVEAAQAVRDEPIPADEKVRRLSRLATGTIASHLPEWTVFFRDLEALSGDLRRDALAGRAAFEDVWVDSSTRESGPATSAGWTQSSSRASSGCTITATCGCANAGG